MKELLKPKSKWNIIILELFYRFFAFINKYFWDTGISPSTNKSIFPEIGNYRPFLLANEIVEVQPMEPLQPLGVIFYMDYRYEGNTKTEEKNNDNLSDSNTEMS